MTWQEQGLGTPGTLAPLYSHVGGLGSNSSFCRHHSLQLQGQLALPEASPSPPHRGAFSQLRGPLCGASSRPHLLLVPRGEEARPVASPQPLSDWLQAVTPEASPGQRLPWNPVLSGSVTT